MTESTAILPTRPGPSPPKAAPRPARSRRLGVEIGPRVVRLAEVGERDGRIQVLAVAAAVRPVNDGALSSTVRAAAAEAGITAKDAVAVWTDAESAGTVHPLMLDLPRMGPAELRKVSLRELTREARGGLTGFAVAHTLIAPPAPGRLSRVFAVAASATGVDRACRILTAARLNPRAVLAPPDALRGLRALAPGLPLRSTFALVQIDGVRGHVGVFEGSSLLFWREFGWDFDAVTTGDGAQALDLGASEADRSEDPLAARFADEVERSLTFFAQQHRGVRVESVFVGGPEGLCRRIVAAVAADGVHACQPLAEKDVPRDPAEFGLAAGAAAARGAVRPANLCPPHVRQRPEVKAVAIGAGVLVVAAVVAGLSLEAGISARYQETQQELGVLKAQYEALSQVRAAREALEKVRDAKLRWQGVLARMDRYHDRWPELWLVLADAAPPSVVFERLDVARDAVTYRVTIKALVKGAGLKQVEEAVAELERGLGRLRSVRNLQLMPAESRRVRDGYKVEVKASFELAASSPVG